MFKWTKARLAIAGGSMLSLAIAATCLVVASAGAGAAAASGSVADVTACSATSSVGTPSYKFVRRSVSLDPLVTTTLVPAPGPGKVVVVSQVVFQTLGGAENVTLGGVHFGY